LLQFVASAQKSNPEIVQFQICKIFVNIDSLKKSITKEKPIYIVMLRAEADPEPNNTITPLNKYLNYYDKRFIQIISYELKSTDGAAFCEFDVQIDGKIKKYKPSIPQLFLITSDARLTNQLPILSTKLYSDNGSVYQLLQINGKDDFYRQLSVLTSEINTVILHYLYDISIENKNKISVTTNDKYTTYKSNKYIDFSTDIPIQYNNKEDILPKNSLFLCSNLNYYFHSKIEHKFSIGLGLAVQFSQIRFKVFPNRPISDTTQNYVYDPDGDTYRRVAYADNIEETVTMQTLNLIPHLSLKFKGVNNKWFITADPGIKISNNISSTYQATQGEVSYGGLYKNSTDTMYMGLYDFYQNTKVYDKKQPLAVKNMYFSFYLPITYYKQISKFYIGLGLYYEIGISNILNNKPNEQIISYNTNSYNSLLYRTNSVKISSFGVKISLSYKF